MQSAAANEIVRRLNKQRAGGEMFDFSRIQHRILEDEIFPQIENIYSKIDMLHYWNGLDEPVDLKKVLRNGAVIGELVKGKDMDRLVIALRNVPQQIDAIKTAFGKMIFYKKQCCKQMKKRYESMESGD